MAATFDTYRPSRPSRLAQKKMTKHSKRVDEDRCSFYFHPEWFINLTSTESPLLRRAVVGPEMSSDSNVYDAMDKFIHSRDNPGLQGQERPKCADDKSKRQHSCSRCALNATCFGNSSNPWHPDPDCPHI